MFMLIVSLIAEYPYRLVLLFFLKDLKVRYRSALDSIIPSKFSDRLSSPYLPRYRYLLLNLRFRIHAAAQTYDEIYLALPFVS
jgi:hypothetical protein